MSSNPQNSRENHPNASQLIDFIEQFKIAPRGAISALEQYVELLTKWNAKINLVSSNTLPEIWTRHILDSAQLLRYIPTNIKTIMDVGSGAGLPGIIIAALNNNIKVISVESDSRKAIFQQEAARILKLNNFEIINKRVEDLENIYPDAITCRAFASLYDILWQIRKINTKECLNLFLKGSTVQTELDEAKKKFSFDFELISSVTDAKASVIKLKNVTLL